MRGRGPVGVAVVGAGSISSTYLEHLTAFPDIAVCLVADLVPERAAAQAAAHGVPRAGSLEQALADDDVEIVVNLTIPAVHAEVAAAALAAGKHVWNEKPLALHRSDAANLVAAAASAGLRIGGAPDTFLGPGLQTVQRLILDGAIGRPISASMVMQNPGPHSWHPNPDFLYQHGGGPLFDMGPYYLTALVQNLGPIRQVAAFGNGAGPTRTIGSGPRAGQDLAVEVDTTVQAIYRFAAGATAHGTFSFDAALVRAGVLEILGTDGAIVLPDPNGFGGPIELVRTEDDRVEIPVLGIEAGRGVGVLDLARSLRAQVPHRAAGELALHVLDAMVATTESSAGGLIETVHSEAAQPEPLPPDWDPFAATL